jgi:methionyl-tRNA synthetase
MEDAEFRKAMGEMRAIWVAGNEYMTRAAPWTHIKTDRAKAAVGVRMGLNLVHQFAHLLWPVMPDFARTIHECIQPVGYRGGVIPFPDAPMAELLDDLTPGQPIKAPEALIAKISDEQVAEWKARFGGVSQ